MFPDNLFTIAELTASINELPYSPRRIGKMNLFQEKGVATTTVAIENQNGLLRLIPSMARGSSNQAAKRVGRKVRTFSIPHLPLGDLILADDVQGIRTFGTEDSTGAITTTVNDTLEALRQAHEDTWELHRKGALTGIILDADGSTLYNLFDEFGIAQPTETFVPGTAGDSLTSVMNVKRVMQAALGGLVDDIQIHALCSREFFETFVKSADIKDAYARWNDGEWLRQDNRSGFEIYGVTWEEYDLIGSTRLIPANKVQFFPVNANGTFIRRNAPADYIETVNTLGLPIYAKQEPMKFGKGTEIETQSNPLHLCTRPGVLVQGTL